MPLSPAGLAFRAARDLLLDTARDLDAARTAFTWPDVGPHFNWAVDWFDGIAEGNARVALRIAEEDGSERSATFEDLRLRSNRVANWLGAQGIGRATASC